LPTAYVTALPLMESAQVPRLPAPVMMPRPLVVIQFIRLLGPAWNTVPFAWANGRGWLSARKTPAGSWVRILLASMPRSLCQLPVAPLGVAISPFLSPAESYHEPPSVSTLPFDRVVSAL